MKSLIVLILMFVPIAAFAENGSSSKFSARIEALEKNEGGHIGVAAFNSESGEQLVYRGDERFAMCSTFKMLLVASILSRIDAGKESLDRSLSFDALDIQSHAPISKKFLAQGYMTVAELSAAAIQYSDNTAANLLLKSIGGPQALTEYLRSLSDSVTRLDRYEPTLNSNLPGDPRDTTTPSAMVSTMRKLLIGDALSAKSRDQLNDWLLGTHTGSSRLRAGINRDWKIGDKTGTGQNGAASDVAIVWPTGHSPFLIAVYYSRSTISAHKRDEVIAQVGRAVSSAFYPEH
jgi:beta-lactamase class A